MADPNDGLDGLPTGTIGRRLRIGAAGLRFGAQSLGQMAGAALTGDDPDKARQRRSKNAKRFARELGKLKGSIVKVGQIMATYGEYMLPEEVTEALHSLDDSTEPLRWSLIEAQLISELGARLEELEVDPEPLAAASLAQVHRATRRSDGASLCLKIQYPDVHKTIDADLNDLIRLLKLTRMIESSRTMDDWLQSIRELLHNEVDYGRERASLETAAASLTGDDCLHVPKVYPDYCSDRVLAMSFEAGVPVTHPTVRALPDARRKRLGQALLRLFLTELYDWQSMQTDPNFGNFLVRIGEGGQPDQLVLLDFGAMRDLEPGFVQRFTRMIEAAIFEDRDLFTREAIALGFMKDHFPQDVLDNFADVGTAIVEPMKPDLSHVPDEALGPDGEYDWHGSDLPKRVAKQAVQASLSRHFALPPKEFMYVIRKLLGVYTFISALEARFNGFDLIRPNLRHYRGDGEPS